VRAVLHAVVEFLPPMLLTYGLLVGLRIFFHHEATREDSPPKKPLPKAIVMKDKKP
jgi:hypothetical protein